MAFSSLGKVKEQVVGIPPDAPFNIWCDGEVVVIKDMSDRPMFSRRLEYGKVRFYPKVDQQKKEGGDKR